MTNISTLALRISFQIRDTLQGVGHSRRDCRVMDVRYKAKQEKLLLLIIIKCSVVKVKAIKEK